MAIQGIEGVISQLQATAMTARNQNVAEQQPSISFAGQLHAALDRISDTQTAARTQSREVHPRRAGRGVKRCDDRFAKSLGLPADGDRVRNKLVSAYQEVMGMQV